jgi:type VI protein secretion system component Hcp
MKRAHDLPPERRDEREEEARRAAPAPAAELLALQRSAGNRAVTQMLARDGTKAPPKPAPPTETKGWVVKLPGVGDIPVESVQWSASPGQKGETGPKEIHFTSKQGEHSAALFRASLSGSAVDAEVVLTRGNTVVRIKLKDALVSQYSVSGGDPPMESWTLNATAITFQDKKEEEQAPTDEWTL